jgi:hypothetical protein
VFVTPTDGQSVSGSVPITVSVVGGSDTYTGADVSYVYGANGPTSVGTSGSGTRWSATWSALPWGGYTFTATVTNASGCSKSATISVTATPAPTSK